MISVVGFVTSCALSFSEAFGLCSDTGQCSAENLLRAKVQAAKDLVVKWATSTGIPGNYLPAIDRLGPVPGDLGDYGFPTKNETIVQNIHYFPKRVRIKRVLKTVATLLYRGMSRMQDVSVKQLELLNDATQIDPLLVSVRKVFNSYMEFWRSVSWTVRYGTRQVDLWNPEDMEFGPETNFWLKFRPTLHCYQASRLGPELGGHKIWCNPHHFEASSRHFVLSLGSGNDFSYENAVFGMWPESTVVTADCTTFWRAGMSSFNANRSQHVIIPKCLDSYTKNDRVTYPQMMRELLHMFPGLSVDRFDIMKLNIEGYEYPLLGHMFQDSDIYFRGTAQVQIEIHRPGMQGYGLNFHSLIFGQLLVATFMSGGFHPVAIEKWHDSTACSDIVFVNQTWFLESEQAAYRNIWSSSNPSHMEQMAAKASKPRKLMLDNLYAQQEGMRPNALGAKFAEFVGEEHFEWSGAAADPPDAIFTSAETKISDSW